MLGRYGTKVAGGSLSGRASSFCPFPYRLNQAAIRPQLWPYQQLGICI